MDTDCAAAHTSLTDEKFHSLVEYSIECASLCVFWISPEGAFLHANRSACERLGYSRAELLGLTVSDVDPDFPPERRARHWQEFKKKKVLTFETRHRTKDGHVFPVEVIDHYVSFHGHEYELAFATDITQLKEHKRALDRKEARYQTLVESLNEGIWTIDVAGVTTFINKRMATMLGYARADMAGKSIYSFLSPDYYGLAKKVFSADTETKNIKHDLCLLKKDKTALYVTIEATPIMDDSGAYQGCMCGIVDITEKKAAEVALTKQAGLLEQKNKALKEVLARIEAEKEEIKHNVYYNVTELIFPVLDSLRDEPVSKARIDLLRKNLEDLTSSFGKHISDKKNLLSPREREVCNLIRQGISSKDISKLLTISPATTERYRNNIRTKLGLVNQKINLSTYLQNM